MSFHAKDFAGSHCGCRYQQDYRPTLGRDGKKESGTLEVIKFYYDGAIRFEQHCYGEAATFVFGVWASGQSFLRLKVHEEAAAHLDRMEKPCVKFWERSIRPTRNRLTRLKIRSVLAMQNLTLSI